jgi:type II secretory pathway component GspD/PulD (secretin)
MSRNVRILLSLAAFLGLTLIAWDAHGQGPRLMAQRQEELPPPTGLIRMNLQGDVKLDALVGFVSQRLGVRFEYSDEIAARTITLRTPQDIPVASLPVLLGSVLRTKGLAIVDSDTAGWKRIVEVKDMTKFATPGKAAQAIERDGPASVVTQVFLLKNLDAESLSTVLAPFKSDAGASITFIKEANSLIVTDYAASVKTISDLLDIIDKPAGEGSYQFYDAKYQVAQTLTEQVKGILASQLGTVLKEGASTPSIRLFVEPVGKRIVIAGNEDLVKRALDLLKRLDVSLGVTTQVYRIRNTNAERIDKLIKGFVAPPNDETSYQTTVDEEGNLLIVRGSEEVHRQVTKLISELDTAVDAAESPIQFYKLKNASALDVLYSLLALQEAYGTGGYAGGMAGGFYSPFGGLGFTGPGFGFPNAGQPQNGSGLQVTPLPLAPNNGMREPMVQPRQNPLARPTTAAGPAAADGMGVAGTTGATAGMNPNAAPSGFMNGGYPNSAMANVGLGGGGAMGGGVASLPGGARVSADVSTNSLIVYAPASVQPMYAKLIESLDQRRPQVLIEAQIIAIDTSDNYSVGVEFSNGDREGAKRLFRFTSFGLSEVNRDTGNLRIIPGLGFNGTLVDPEVADVVIRALANHTRARVLAAPKILVNDNSTGKLESVTSVPFASINASQTVSTTSLGGNQQAGTIITVTPHINEDDHLQLDFDVEFSTFSGTGATGLPPPRQIDRVGSTVTIPDGQTIVVGGLKRVGDSYTFSGVPWTEKIPILRELTSSTDSTQATMSFFLFIRPMVLRDSRFGDLRYLSDKDTMKACLPGEFPTSQPELLR